MIDPRFATTSGAIPLQSGYGAPQPVPSYQYHHHHHHHKHKNAHDGSPLSRDESIHKVDHGRHHHFQQNNEFPLGTGYGIPNTAVGYGTEGGVSYYQQQPYAAAATYGYPSQYPSVSYGQVPFTSDLGNQTPRRHRRHHRHHRHHHHNNEGLNIAVPEQPVEVISEQVVGQRSSSVLANESQAAVPLEQLVDGEINTGEIIHHRHHRHHRHHEGGELAGFRRSRHSRGHSHDHHHHHHHRHGHSYGSSAIGADGYGHINNDLIFIERGDHSPHRQEPPSGYEYKGKIEVQGVDKEYHTHSTVQAAPIPPAPSAGPCPPGWQQMVLTGGSCGPCPTGGVSYVGQPVSTAAPSVGYGSYGATTSYPMQCQLIEDYYVGSNAGSVSTGYPQTAVTTYGQQAQTERVEQRVSERAKIIEVWQKRSKSEPHEGERPRTPLIAPSVDLDGFRNEILAAIERIPRGQEIITQVPAVQGEVRTEVERIIEKAPGEVRVIVQPIQPVFYMPRQTGSTTPTPHVVPTPIIQQVPASAPQVVYVPRNVYVPVIKPVFVPRERVIVRPQVIHVARPVLVDRPVPVTQRPIIIDRERPVPVPVRVGGGQAQQAGGSKVVREEYVYRDNLPVAYGGRCAEFAGGVNYGYVPRQQQQQNFSTSSVQESASLYQGGGLGAGGSLLTVNAPNQFQESQSSSYLNVQNAGGAGAGLGSAYGSYSSLANVGAVNVGQQAFQQTAQIAGLCGGSGPTQIEILDTTVNPRWQKTDQSSLVRRYGRPAYDIVHKGDLVEQQMCNELARSSSAGMIRSASSGSYISGAGI